jgi:hypothetical protein
MYIYFYFIITFKNKLQPYYFSLNWNTCEFLKSKSFLHFVVNDKAIISLEF